MTVTIRYHGMGKWFWTVETETTYCDGLVYSFGDAWKEINTFIGDYKPPEPK